MDILDVFFPKTCLGCGDAQRYICQNCMNKVSLTRAICAYCKHPSIDGATHANCQKKLGVDGLTSVWEHEGIVRKAILALKYKYATRIGEELSEYLINSLQGKILPNVQYLAPIPIYWYKQNTRGFNQSIEIGGNIAEKMRLKFIPDLLIKSRSTMPQAGLSGEDRRRNLRGTFILNTKYQIPDSVFIFDDVFTTGSTIFEATKVLKRGGVKKVWGLTIAR